MKNPSQTPAPIHPVPEPQKAYQKPQLSHIAQWQVITGSICEIGDPGC